MRPRTIRRVTLEKVIQLKNLHQLADGFNIEGGNLEICCTNDQRWMNICMPLDFPFLTNKTLENITQNNCYSLKEMSIDEYNECDVNLFLMLVIEYFRIEGDNLLIQIHRGKSGWVFIEKFSKILLAHYNDCIEIIYTEFNLPIFCFDNGFILKLIVGHGINDSSPTCSLGVKVGYEKNTIVPHPEFKNLCSLSLMGGLNPKLNPGSITLPSIFIPFNVDTNIVDFSREYLVDNYLIKILDKVLSLPQKNFFPVINNFASENLSKNHQARNLAISDIKADNIRLLLIDRLYNPTKADHDKFVQILTDE